MPHLTRPDGVEIYWEEAGDGPAVLVCNTFNLSPVDTLVELLAPSRRVLTYEPRGTGRSTQAGPYDMETGVADVVALLEATGPAAVALGVGDGAHRAVRVAAAHPDLVEHVVITSTNLGGAGAGGFSGSPEVLEALMSLMRRDYRSGLRSMVAGAGHRDDSERARVEELAAAIPQEAAIGYLESWIAADSRDAALALGSRLTIAGYAGNAWFPLEMFEDLNLSLPESRYELVEDGPMNRPDLTAELLLRVTA